MRQEAMGILKSTWEGANFSHGVQRLPFVFQARTGLELHVEASSRTEETKPTSWWLSVPALEQSAFVDFWVRSSSELGISYREHLANERIDGSWTIPTHPYLWHQIQASLAELGFRSVSRSPQWPTPDQKVPRRWNRPWNELSFLRRKIYGRPDLWPLWF